MNSFQSFLQLLRHVTLFLALLPTAIRRRPLAAPPISSCSTIVALAFNGETFDIITPLRSSTALFNSLFSDRSSSINKHTFPKSTPPLPVSPVGLPSTCSIPILSITRNGNLLRETTAVGSNSRLISAGTLTPHLKFTTARPLTGKLVLAATSTPDNNPAMSPAEAADGKRVTFAGESTTSIDGSSSETDPLRLFASNRDE
ncbi:hypothetical protein HID58_082497, partial [Brassica napus]